MTIRFLRPTWAEISLENFRANVDTVGRLTSSETGIMPVVKANAYGIGAVPAARTALLVPRVKGLAVATPDEALELRDQGIEGLMLVLGPVTEEAVRELVRADVSVAVTGVEGLQAADTAGRSLDRKTKVHLKIETGMGRVGMTPGLQIDAALAFLAGAEHIDVEGVFTHFAVADTDRAYTVRQMEVFEAVLNHLSRQGVSPRFRHAANSAAILDFPRAHLDLVRPGIMLYGSYPDPRLAEKAALLPVLSLFSRVSHVKRVPAGFSVGYGRTYRTSGETTIATVPVGYADGFPRLLSGRGAVLCRGRRLPIAGRICMDQLMFDAKDVPVEVGDLVTLIGSEGTEIITVDEVAGLSQTIAHEVLTGLTARVPRVYV